MALSKSITVSSPKGLTPEEWEHLRPADFSFSNEIDKMNSRLKALELELHEKIRQNKLLWKIIEKCLTQN